VKNTYWGGTKMDGVTHINVYSNGKTTLGQLLSNFAHTPFIGGHHKFESVEGWWYWYCTGKQHDHLKHLYGYMAKKEGKKYKRTHLITPDTLFQVYCAKIDSNPYLREMLIKSTLPFTHYYAYGTKIVKTKFEWTGSLWNAVRTHYQHNL